MNEQVRILQLFNDGWIKVEKVKSLEVSKGKVKVNDSEVEMGMIPIDCQGYTSPTKSTFGF